MLRAFYWALIVLGLYNAALLMFALMLGDWAVALAGGALSGVCLGTAAIVGDDVDGS